MKTIRYFAAWVLVLNLATAPFAPAQAKTAPSANQSIARDFTHPSSALGALGDTTLMGVGLGLLDYAGLHNLDHPVAQDNHGVYAIAKTPNFPFE
ncbi:MAG: hypothetical protein ACYCVM_06825, partial [Acidiferrobacter sp.]